MLNSLIGHKVRVHRSLHRAARGLPVGASRLRGKVVVANVAEITMTFHYWQGGYDKIIAAAAAGHPRRRVCAWARGTVVAAVPVGEGTEITYNPYRGNQFTTRDGSVIKQCEAVHFNHAATAIGAVR